MAARLSDMFDTLNALISQPGGFEGVHSSVWQCIMCYKRLSLPESPHDYLDECFISPNCLDGYHSYCTYCTLKLINESLSSFNQTPKCIAPKCKKPFIISSSKGINSELFMQYKIDIKQYRLNKLLLHAYIRQNKNNIMLIPTDISELIHHFYELILFTEIPCDNCSNPLYDTKIECNKCWPNYGSLYYINFNKVISTQKQCEMCNKYYLLSKITYWDDCNHAYCDICIMDDLRRIHQKISFDEIPMCYVNGCKQELRKELLESIHKLKSINNGKDLVNLYYATKLEMMHKNKTYFECDLCNYWHPNDDMFVLSFCGCKCTVNCIQKYIKNTCSFTCKCMKPFGNNDIELSGYWINDNNSYAPGNNAYMNRGGFYHPTAPRATYFTNAYAQYNFMYDD